MKKLLTILSLFIILSTQAHAVTHQAIAPDIEANDTMDFIAFNSNNPAIYNIFAQLSSNPVPTFDIFPNTTFNGRTLNNILGDYVLSTDLSAALGSVTNGAPSNLDTFGEIAGAINNDPNYSVTVSTAFSTKVDKVSGKGLSTEDYTTAEKTKLVSIADGATANSSDTFLLSRANHTGTQSADTITDGTTNKAYTATEKTKLAGITIGATANSSDAFLLNRTNHIGTQAISTVSGLQTALDGKFAIPTGTTSQVVRGDGTLGTPASAPASTDALTEGTTNKYFTVTRAQAAAQCYSGTTQKLGCFAVVQSATVSSGQIVFNFTVDGTSTGAALFPNGPIQDSVQLSFNDATASYQPGWSWGNSNKTLTVTLNKLGTANILTGLLGQVAAPNGFPVKATVLGN